MLSMDLPGHIVESMHVVLLDVHKVEALLLRVPHRALSVSEQRWCTWIVMRRHLMVVSLLIYLAYR